MKKTCLAVLAAATLACSADGAAIPTASLFNDVILARGQGFEVHRTQLEDAFIAYKANMAARGQTLPEDRRDITEAQLLERMILSEIMVGRATVADKTKAREKIGRFLEESVRAAGGEEGYLRQLRVLGLTPQQFTNRITEQAISEELLAREIRGKIIMTPDRIERFYTTNDAAFRQPQMARASHIMIYTRDPSTRLELGESQRQAKQAKAEKALARARQGEDFAKLIAEISEDPNVKENKGEYLFARAKDDPRRAMLPEFEAAAFALRPGQISDLVKSEYGYHIIKVLEFTPAHKTPLAEVSDKIRDALTAQEAEGQMPAYFDKLKKAANVVILDERLAGLVAKLPKEGLK